MKYILFALSMGLAFSLNAQFIVNNGIEIHNATSMTTNGDWINDASTIVTNKGEIITSESFVNNGTLDEKSTGGFALRYDTDLNFRAGGSEMGFLTKDGSGAALITGTISVRDSLLIRNGVIRLMNSKDTISLKIGALLTSGENAYVEGGLIARAGTGDFVFPFGKDGHYVPLKMYRVNAQKVAASLVNAPATHTAGPGVDALIGFPYAWNVVGKTASDTATYVELSYPNSLPVVANPIIVREIGGQQYASMGARLIEDTGSRNVVKSYARRLNGLFSVAQGFPSDPVTDSLALVALYNSAGGSAWTNSTNWLNGSVETWFGVTVNGQSITAIELPANNLVGPVPEPLIDILSLQTINFSANQLTAIPDLTSNPEISSLNVSDNNLDFASLEPNASIVGINYFIQGNIGTPLETEIPVGTPFEFSLPAQGGSSEYQWKFKGENISDATGPSYLLPAISRETMGEYTAEITNPNVPGLILKSAVQKVLAYANVSGKLFADKDIPAERGELTLYRVQPGAFEPVSTIPVRHDGSYAFEQIILDDYQVRGFADTLLYPKALPTYFENTIFWEEADTLVLANNIDNLNIVSQLEPEPSSGRGSIIGYLQEDDGTGRINQIKKLKRISSAGVSVRRVHRTGRTKEEILTLVAYVFTNDNGEFNLPNLPTGEYRINFQYPGYPMDESSYTTIHIGTALDSQVMVEANVLDGKINVRKLVITGLSSEENYDAEVFPNPSVDRIQLRFTGEVKGRMIMLSDMQGKTVHTLKAEEKNASLNVTAFEKGIYILQINEYGRNVKTLKMIIE